MDLPIACTLSEAELRERRLAVLNRIKHAALGVIPMRAGFAYNFARRCEVLTELRRLVEFERRCCPFLTFKIVAETVGPFIRLEITGPPEATPLISDLFGS